MPQVPDISSALRALLLERAAGKLSREEFERREAELHARLLAPKAGISAVLRRSWPNLRWLIPVPVIIALAAGAGWYAWDHRHPAAAPPVAGAMPGGDTANDMKVLNEHLASLKGEVVQHPLDGNAWAGLGRVYAALGRHAEASDAYAKAAQILPPDAQLLADWADSYVMAHERRWDATSRGFIKKALSVDPKNLKTLSLAASDAFDQADYKTAVADWKRMEAAAPGDASVRQYVEANIADADRAMGVVQPVAAAASPPVAADAAGISGRVSIAADVKAKAAPGDSVFVFARSVGGAGPPLAVKRFTVADLPAEFSLSDADSMVPGLSISTAGKVLVVARVSKGGNPVAQPGDLESKPQTLTVGSKGVKLVIDTVD